MYIDPSRLPILARFVEVARSGSTPELAALRGDARVLLENLWAEAGAEARARYTTAIAAAPGEAPWSAFMLPEVPTPTRGGPAAVELVLGQVDPEDEGVAAFRLVDTDPRVQAIVAGIRAWDTAMIERVVAPSAWRLEGVAPASSGIGVARPGAPTSGMSPVAPGVGPVPSSPPAEPGPMPGLGGVASQSDGGAPEDAPSSAEAGAPGVTSEAPVHRWGRAAALGLGTIGGFAALTWAARRWGGA